MQLAVVGGVGDESAGGLVEVNAVRAEFRGPQDPGQQGDDDDPDDECRGDGDAVRFPDHVFD